MTHVKEEKDDSSDLSSEAVLNESLLAQYREMDARMAKDQLLPRLYHVFEKNFPDYLGKLTQAVQAHDPEQISHYIHKMLGMAHNIGAYRLSQILLHWEQLSLDNKMEIDAAVLDHLAMEFRTAETALGQYIQGGEH